MLVLFQIEVDSHCSVSCIYITRFAFPERAPFDCDRAGGAQTIELREIFSTSHPPDLISIRFLRDQGEMVARSAAFVERLCLPELAINPAGLSVAILAQGLKLLSCKNFQGLLETP